MADLRWITQYDPIRARTVVIELTEHFQRLADLNIRHRVLTDLGVDVRRAVHENYNIYYRFVGDDGPDVLTHILQSSRDLSDIVVD